MIRKESSNSDVYLLVLGRPADPLCTLLSAFLSGKQYPFTVCSSVYQAIARIETVAGNQSVVLVARPAMLISPAAEFLSRRFPNLRMIGWLDSNENLSDITAVRVITSGMTLVNSCDQLHAIIQAGFTCRFQKCPAEPDGAKTGIGDKLDPMEYKLCDDEMNALLGVE